MHNIYMIILISIGIFTILYILYKQITIKKFNLSEKKMCPNISIVFITKNNEKLLEYILENLSQIKKEIYQIIILDLNSIDSTPKIADKFTETYPNIKLLNMSEKKYLANCYSVIQNHIKEEIAFIIDLHKIGMTNPNIYIPDLFKPLNTFLQSNIQHLDTRIDGIKLLYFDEIEREKNSFVLKEYITETLSNVDMQLESFWEQIKSNPENENNQEQIKDIQEYIYKSIKNITLLSRLIGSVKFSYINLNDNMLSIFKDYSLSHSVSINYKVIGLERSLKKPVNNLILGITQDLLYTIVQNNLSSNIDILSIYKSNQYHLVFKYNCYYDNNQLLSNDSELSHYVLQSIQNRLSLLGGMMKINIKSNNTVKILMHLPLDQTTLQNEKIKDEETISLE